MNVDERVIQLGLKFPEIPRAMGLYAPVLVSGGYAYVSGQLPRDGDRIVYQGKVGADLTVEEGYEAARLCALNVLAVLRQDLGSLSRIKRLVFLRGYVQADASFEKHPAVINGASELFCDVFKESGVHARAAIGVSSLPGRAACEIELVCELRSDMV